VQLAQVDLVAGNVFTTTVLVSQRETLTAADYCEPKVSRTVPSAKPLVRVLNIVCVFFFQILKTFHVPQTDQPFNYTDAVDVPVENFTIFNHA